jgi:hypothetical protein
LEPVPYKPNPMKYKYLLSNKYEQLSSLQVQPQRKNTATPLTDLTPESLDEQMTRVENKLNTVEIEKI